MAFEFLLDDNSRRASDHWERHPGATIAFRPYNSSYSDSEHPGVDLTFALRSYTPVRIFKNYMI
ncbi:hypothetical protein HanXRQr2_Chr01g0012801 [Helianthus annuus]|uniref:Uncharacterized protein n=1 Tax=Helianthus annuus TaxID=4232 RepID=A0A9K3JTY8_HELAN|nr:hypothetical protein HanXRQr2_Chr01g0012801 [Helianthus annuus]